MQEVFLMSSRLLWLLNSLSHFSNQIAKYLRHCPLKYGAKTPDLPTTWGDVDFECEEGEGSNSHGPKTVKNDHMWVLAPTRDHTGPSLGY